MRASVPRWTKTNAVYGRTRERATLDALLDAARAGTGTATLIEGEPGIGKTSLCDYARERASDLFVLRARGLEAESQVSFAGLTQLFSPVLAKLVELPQPRRRALGGALAVESVVPADRLLLGVATLNLLAAAAEERPLLVVVDDVHWLDRPSAQALAFAARRLGHEPIAMLFAQRSEAAGALAAADASLLTLGPLSPEDAEALLASAAPSPVAPNVARQLVTATRGNPMALIAAACGLPAQMLAGTDLLPDPLPLEGQLGAAFRRQVTNFSEVTRRALAVLAADTSGSLELVGRALQFLGLQVADLGPAEDAHVAEFDGTFVGFSHPLLRAAVYDGLNTSDRKAVHSALARAAAVCGDLERDAWHRAAAATGPDEEVAAVLERASERAATTGGAVAAAPLLEQAARFTPSGEGRARRLVLAARSLFLSGHAERISDHLDEALRNCTSPRVRADAMCVRAQLMAAGGQSEMAIALVRTEARALAPLDPEQAALMLCEMALPSVWSGRTNEALSMAREATELATPGQLGDMLAKQILGHVLLFRGECAEGERLVWESYARWKARRADMTLMIPGPAVGFLFMENYDIAIGVLDQEIEEARALGTSATLPFLLATRSEVDFLTGRWLNAGTLAGEAVELARETGQLTLEGFGRACLARVLAGQGDDEACRAHAHAAMEIGDRFGGLLLQQYSSAALGLLELGKERPDAAVGHLAPAFTDLLAQGNVHPGSVRVGGDLLEALARSGDRAGAERTLAIFDEQAERASTVWAKAAVLRARALLASDGEAEALFSRALEVHAQTPTPFERARTDLCFAEWLQIQHRHVEVRQRLHLALATFERLGAEPWAERARSGLRAEGETVEPAGVWWKTLTCQELQVALAVAGGASNKEVALSLFVGARTIEFHLGSVYRKLGIHSRSQLTRIVTSAKARSAADRVDRMGVWAQVLVE